MDIILFNRTIYFTGEEIDWLEEYKLITNIEMLYVILNSYGVDDFWDEKLSDNECHNIVLDAVKDYNNAIIKTHGILSGHVK